MRRFVYIPFLSVLAALLLFCFPANTKAQITVTTNHTGQELAEYLVGKGILVSNVVFSGADDIAGKFHNRFTALGLDSGIVLTNGLARTVRSVPGIDQPPGVIASNNRNGRGDDDIDLLLQQGGAPPALRSHDACFLEFDFIPTGDTVEFRYTFASDEYPDYNCSQFNDIFIFYISGPGISGKKNMAIVPGTTNVPVAINSINNGIVNPRSNITNCEALGAGSPFTQYYVDNTSGSDIVYNGMTVTLRAFHAVRACQTYHLKLVIADIGDFSFDSGVFLEAGSFKSEYASLTYNGPTVNGEPVLTEGCDTATITVKYSRPLPAPKDLNFETGGAVDNFSEMSPFVPTVLTLPAGQTELTFPISAVQDQLADDNEFLTIFVSPKTCGTPIYTDSLRIRIRDYKPVAIVPPFAGFCPGNPGIQLQVNTPGLTSFNWTPAAGLSNPNIGNPVAAPDTTTLYTLNGNFTATCRGRGETLITVKDSNSIVWQARNISCFGNDGSISVLPGIVWVNPQYSLNGSPFSNQNNFTGLTPGWYLVKVRDASGCEASKNIRLVQNEALTATLSVVTANCFGRSGKVIVRAVGGQRPYQYSLNNLNFQGDSTIIVDAGNYTLYVKDDFGCPFSIPFTITSDPPIQFSTVITPDSCRGLPDGTVTVNAGGGSGIFSYSANGTTFQAANLLNLAAGTYTLTVKDDKDCFTDRNIVVPLNNTVFVNAGSDSTLCEGKTLTIAATSNAGQFLWTPATGLDDATKLQPKATPSVTTQYKITATAGLCERADSLTIFINPAPVAQAGNDTAICFNNRAQLNGSGSIQYLWYPAQYISNRFIANPQVYPRTSSAYWLHVTDLNGCRSLLPDTVWIKVVPPVRAFAGNDTIVSINQPLQLGATGGTAYNWSPALGLNNAGIANPVAVLQNHQSYTVTVSTPEGCSGTATINIKVFKGPEIYVAGAFTPNKDGNNDLLYAIPAGIKRFRYFRIYNRWGKEIFSTTDYRQGWNGNLGSNGQPQDTYVWMAEAEGLNGQVLFRKGTVVLIR